MRPTMEDLAAEVANCLGLPQVDLVVSPIAGAAHLAYEVHDPGRASAGSVAFLRCESGSFVPDPYGLAREAVVLRAARRLEIPVPDVLGTIGSPAGLLMSMVRGTSRLSPDDAETVGAEYLGLIARVHSLDPKNFGLKVEPTITAAISAELDRWRSFCTDAGVFEVPLMKAGARILAVTMPDDGELPSLVHGDVGAGNFMAEHGKITAVLDWELAHVGDPHEDLAWLWMRCAHTPFGDLSTRFAEYERAAGCELDPRRLQWHLAFVMWKSCAAMHAATRRPSDRATFVQNLVIVTYSALLGSQLLRLLGSSMHLLADEPVLEVGPPTRMADRVLDSDVLTNEQRVMVSYLREIAGTVGWESGRAAADRAELLGGRQDPLIDVVDTASDDDLLAVAMVLARSADRAAAVLPNAVRRIQRAQGLGLGTGLASTIGHDPNTGSRP